MEFSMRFLAAMSLLLLVSVSTDATCDLDLCEKGCKLLDYNLGCCGVLEECSYCFCYDADKCPITRMEIKIGEKTMMIVATPKKSFIKELVA